ncbi:anti-sigma factor family protein [Chloroflexota bacterium]
MIGRKGKCSRFRGMLSEYLDDRLSNEDRDSVARHIETCEACSKEFETLQMTVRLLNHVPMVPAPRSFALREAEVSKERAPEPRRWGRLSPVPVLAASGADAGRTSIFDLQRMRWLRPATAFATAALVLLLMLDFLQVVPHGGGIDTPEMLRENSFPVMLSPSPEAGQGGYELEDDKAVEAPPRPAPTDELKGELEDGASNEITLGAPEAVELYDEAAGGWPMRQVEIAVGSILFTLVAILMFSWRRRRRLSRV